MANDILYWFDSDRRICFADEYNGRQGWLSFNFDDYGITMQQISAYLDSLVKHIVHVREAGLKLGVSTMQLEDHDSSKFSLEELPHYVRNFHGDKQNPDGFAGAWLHHIHNNPHHWQHWIFSDGFTPKGSNVCSGVVEMPEQYALEMIADWMGSSMAYTGSWDMTDWLIGNLPKIKMHPNTAAYVEDVLIGDYQPIFEILHSNNIW